MPLERGQIGTAKDTEPGDWVLIFSKNPRTRSSDPKLEGASSFTVIEGEAEATPQAGNSRVLTLDGSISGNTIVKKVASDSDHS